MVERKVRKETRISVKLIKVECIVSLCAVNKYKNASLEGPGGHLLPVYKGLGWRFGAAEYGPMGKKFPSATTNKHLSCKEQITEEMQCSNNT